MRIQREFERETWVLPPFDFSRSFLGTNLASLLRIALMPRHSVDSQKSKTTRYRAQNRVYFFVKYFSRFSVPYWIYLSCNHAVNLCRLSGALLDMVHHIVCLPGRFRAMRSPLVDVERELARSTRSRNGRKRRSARAELSCGGGYGYWTVANASKCGANRCLVYFRSELGCEVE